MANEVPKTLEEILKTKIPHLRKDPLKTQMAPCFMMRRQLIPEVYNENQFLVRPVSPPLQSQQSRSCEEEKTPDISYYKIRPKLQQTERITYYDEAVERQQLFNQGFTLTDKNHCLYSVFPCSAIQKPTRRRKKFSVCIPVEEYNRQRKYKATNDRSQIRTLLANQGKSLAATFDYKWTSRTRKMSAIGALSREKIKNEIKSFTFHRRGSTESHRKECIKLINK